jgi:hypothetical protein
MTKPWKTYPGLLLAMQSVVLLVLMGLAPSAGAAGCPNEAIREAQHSTFLRDCRAYEMASPPDKNGGSVGIDSWRTRAASDGSAVGFVSLTPFTGASGSSVDTDYLAERSSLGPGPLGTGWTTHSITAPQESLSLGEAAKGLDSYFIGEFDQSVELGVFAGASPLTEDPDVAAVPNLYLRTDLRSVGAGGYQLLTSCPICATRDETEGPGKGALEAPETELGIERATPILAASNAEKGQFLFDSREPLTAGAVPPSMHLFEFHAGTVTLVSRVPTGTATECDDVAGPACKPAPSAAAGQADPTTPGLVGWPTPGVFSDGSDGHSRAFFTLNPGLIQSGANEGHVGGRLYLREDGHYTAQLNASERHTPDTTGPAAFWDASSNGERVFFTTTEALTEDAPVGPQVKLYEYDATKPGSDPHNLTYIAEANAVVGMSVNGSYLYFEKPTAGSVPDLELWHNGVVSFVGEGAADALNWIASVSVARAPRWRATRVTPDGTWLLFNSGGDSRSPGRLSLYDASSSSPASPDVVCVSCLAGGGPEASSWFINAEVEMGNEGLATHESHALSADGRYVFFTTPERLVPEDHNDTPDVYEYDSSTGTVSLLSSGAEQEGSSWLLDASPDGHDVFIGTEQPLVGWDTDRANDLYDVRIDGGFPEPSTTTPCGSSDSCSGAASSVAPASGVVSNTVLAGNPAVKPPPPPPTCPSGEHPSRIKGQLRCVRPPCPKGRHRVRIKHRQRCVAVTHTRTKRRGGR